MITRPKISSPQLKHSLWSTLGISVCASLLLTACNKTPEESEVEVVETEETVVVEEPAEQVVACDDQVAVSQLSNAVRSSLNKQTETLLTTYANRAEVTVDMASAKSAIGSILVDVANSQALPSDDASGGMTTCRASLSLTLPNEDVQRAKNVYDSIEGEDLTAKLADMNISLNNNMVVSDSFTYVVGMQGGQAVAKVAGQPDVTRTVADILAKSQFKKALDASRPAPVAPAQPARPAQPAQPSQSRPQASPQPPAQPAQPKPTPKPAPAQPAPQPKPEPAPQPEPKPEPKPTPAPAENLAPSAPVSSDSDLTVPTDDSIDMVIIEEEGTY